MERGHFEATTYTPGDSQIVVPVVGHERIPLTYATGIILSGGLGTRLEEVTHGKTPKTVLPLNRRTTILDNPVSSMRQAGVRDIYIITHDFNHDGLRTCVRGNNNFDGIQYIVEDSPPKGSVNAINTLIREKGIQTTLVKANGDEAFVDFDLKAMYEAHVRGRHPITCLFSDSSEGSEKYSVWVDGTNRVIDVKVYDPTAPTGAGFSLTGVWIIEPSQFELLAQSATGTDFMGKAIASQVLYGHPSHSRFFNVNTPQDLERARFAFRG